MNDDEMESSTETVALDATDLRILDQLQTDASLTNQALAERIHSSPATCLRRVKRLVDAGVIERRIALLSPERLGAGVQQCYRVSPGPDFMLVLQVADMAAYHALVQRLFTEDANVRNVKAFFSVFRAKFEPRIVLLAAAPDHPMTVTFPEGEYLKGLVVLRQA